MRSFRYVAILMTLLSSSILAEDWPMRRCTPNRSATTSGALATTLHLQRVREYPQLSPAWPLYFDVALSPAGVVSGS